MGTRQDNSSVLIVSANGNCYGLPVRDVIEVLDDVAITPVPGVASSVRGVVRYQRGVVAVVPLSHIVGLGAPHETGKVTVVVVQSTDATVAIEVADALDVIDASKERWSVGSVEHDGHRIQLIDVASVAKKLEDAEVVAT